MRGGMTTESGSAYGPKTTGVGGTRAMSHYTEPGSASSEPKLANIGHELGTELV